MEPEEPEEILQNKDPEIVKWGIGSAVEILQTYGWFILLGLIALYLIYQRFLKPSVNEWRNQREQNSYKKMDAGNLLGRMEAMERSRQRMQDEMDEKAKTHVEKQKEKEEKKREERIEEWKRHQEGKGYYNKSKGNESKSSDQQPSSSKSSQPKKSLRPDFNPLMGDSGGACFRPARRGGGASGGG